MFPRAILTSLQCFNTLGIMMNTGCVTVNFTLQLRHLTHSSKNITKVELPVPHALASQRSLHNAPIFRLLLKVAVNGTHQCDFLNFCGALGLQHEIVPNFVEHVRNAGASLKLHPFITLLGIMANLRAESCLCST